MNQDQWEACVKFHGHSCPGLAYGFRAVEVAQSVFGVMFHANMDEDLVCVSENDACGVDAIQYLSGCTVGKGNLVFRHTGKMAYSFFLRKTGKKLRILYKPNLFLPEMDREQKRLYLLTAPVEKLMVLSEPKYESPPQAKVFDSIVCEMCGEASVEYKIHLQGGKKVCEDCFEPYSRLTFR